MKIFSLLLLISFAGFANAGAYNYELSDKLDISQLGWDKVLQMSNGNTVLFHFDARKPIVVKVFGPDRKEKATYRFIGKLIDVVALENSDLHGIYEINGEAVVFISQAITNRNTLVALRFNAETGAVIREQELIASSSFQKKITFSLVKNTVSGGYAVFCMRDLVANPHESLNMLLFDDRHNIVQDVPITVKTGDYDYVNHVSTYAGNDGGIAVFLDCMKIVQYPDINDHFFTTCYLGQGDTAFTNVMTKMPQHVGPLYSVYTINEFGNTLNVFLVNVTTLVRQHGLQALQERVYTPFMLSYSKGNMADMKYSPIQHALANKQLKAATDTGSHTEPVPIAITTNKYGVSTMVAEENIYGVRFANGNTAASCIGNIVVTKLGEDGKEIWSETLPKRQFLLNFLPIEQIQKRGTHTQIFRRRQLTSDWLYQFASFYSFTSARGDFYVIYNDMRSNFDKKLGDKPDPMSSYTDPTNITNAGAVCYKVTQRRESSKRHLLGDEGTSVLPGTAMVESLDYSEASNTCAGLFYVVKNGEEQLRLGWVKMD